MKVLLFMTTLSLFIAIGLCQTINPQLIGGTRTTITNYPYMAGIFTRNHFTCGGAIINYRSVLTAAHCILATASSINVIVGSTRQDGRGGITHRVSTTFLHPQYLGPDTQLVADIAVVRTLFPFTFTSNVRPITLGPNQVIGANERVSIAGWGLIGTNDRDVTDQLMVLEMSTISNSLCSNMHQNIFTRDWITSEKLCTLGVQMNTGLCAGDSGGPLVWRNTVIGIASWTVRPCAENPSVFIRTANHLQWIRSNL